MPVNTIQNALSRLQERRRILGMSEGALAARSGVSRGTVRRILSGDYKKVTFAHVVAVADALGVLIELADGDPDAYREAQALKKARELVGLVQGTMGLESQAVDATVVEHLIQKTVHQLLAGPKRRLWSA